MQIRNAKIEDLDIIANVEKECFPINEAATKDEFKERIKHYANHFLLMFDKEKLIAFIDGFVTDAPDLTDDMYSNAKLHNEKGNWQMIFGLNTLPSYRKQGYGGQLVQKFIEIAKKQKRKGLVLTCKDHLINYYAKFGFINEGKSKKSTHGNVEWSQMRLTF